MAASLLLLIAARSTMSCANRLKVIPRPGVLPRIMTDPMMQHFPMMHTQVKVPQRQMNVDANSKDDAMSRVVVPDQGWKASINDRGLSAQRFPPDLVSGIEPRHVLHDWRDLYTNSLQEKVGAVVPTNTKLRKNEAFHPPPKTLDHARASKIRVLSNMRDIIIDARTIAMHRDTPTIFEHLASPTNMASGHLADVDDDFITTRHLPKPEIVGLIPKELLLNSTSSAIDKSLGALAVFSRIHLKDNRRHSLHKKLLQLSGNRHWWSRLRWGRTKKGVNVFAIEGLANAPGLTEQAARVLLSKIVKYAHEEQMIVVVPQWAYTSSDGTDLTEYYVRLGFKKVEMEEGLYDELVYTGTALSAEDMSVENEHMMVGMKLWKGA